MDTAPQLDPLPAARRPRFLVFGAIALAVAAGVTIYFFLTREGPAVEKIAAQNTSQIAGDAAQAPTAPATIPTEAASSPTATPVAVSNSGALTLQELIASSPEEKARYERHLGLLDSETTLERIVDSRSNGVGELPPDAAAAFQTALKVVSDDLDSDTPMAEEIRLQANYRVNTLKSRVANSSQTGQSVSVYAIQELAGIVKLVKQDSEIFYGTKIDDIMKRSSLPLASKLTTAYTFAEMHDPAVSADLSEWLRAVIANDVANVVVADDDKLLAEQLLTQLKEV